MPTVGRNEEAIRSYIRQQENKDARLDQLNLWCRHHLQVVPKSGPRQRPRTAASSGSSRNAPGFAGGYLLLVLKAGILPVFSITKPNVKSHPLMSHVIGSAIVQSTLTHGRWSAMN